ncbi:hypothetical protein [Flavobacterium sp.]|uniref:hypothetical protein n=1 Tax=Flavobacterium sp. TaxID=239 RepID=UPI00262FA01B|nr:hypothetical protein [Flavobacterium sp.]
MMVSKKGSFRRSVVAFALGILACAGMNHIAAMSSEIDLNVRSSKGCLYASQVVKFGDVVKLNEDIYFQCVQTDLGGAVFTDISVLDAEVILANANNRN